MRTSRAGWQDIGFGGCGAIALVVTVLMGGAREHTALRAQTRPGRRAPAAVYLDVYNGWKWWHVYCYRCHGVNAVGGTNAPNLTDANFALAPEDFLTIVKTGTADKGMQSWSKLLDDKQIAQIHLYVRARTDKVLPAGRPDEVGPNGSKWPPPAGWPAK